MYCFFVLKTCFRLALSAPVVWLFGPAVWVVKPAILVYLLYHHQYFICGSALLSLML
jgi:hypothetical protein